MEGLARRVLHKPLEITVGGRSVVSPEISQLVEIHNDEDTKFLRLLEILGYWYDEEKDQRMLIFVDRQEAADELLRELFRRGYPSLSLHGGKVRPDAWWCMDHRLLFSSKHLVRSYHIFAPHYHRTKWIAILPSLILNLVFCRSW